MKKYCRLVDKKMVFSGDAAHLRPVCETEMYASSVTGSETNSSCWNAGASEYKHRLIMVSIHIGTI